MMKGYLYAFAACFIWSMTFVIPGMLKGYDLTEIVLGRYLFYGLVSSFLYLKAKKTFPLTVWRKAFLYALIYAVGFYPLVILGLSYSNAAATTLVMGMSPIVVILYGNFREKECSFRQLWIPCLCILTGLLVVNVPKVLSAEFQGDWGLGLIAAATALAVWCWYVVAGGRYLKKNPEVSSSDWSTLNGLGTLICTLIYVIGAFFFAEEVSFVKYFSFHFLLGSAVLGIACSWLAFFFWYKASSYLPVTLMGQLSICITIFSLLLIYPLEKTFPSIVEIFGISLFLTSIFYGVRRFSLN